MRKVPAAATSCVMVALLVIIALVWDHRTRLRSNGDAPGAVVSVGQTATTSTSVPTLQRVTTAATPQVALDVAAVRLPDGHYEVIKISPPATDETLRERLRDLNALPVVRVPVPEAGSPAGLGKILTRDLTLRLTAPFKMPALPAGVSLKQRPAYAPEYAIVQATDALGAVDAVKSLSTLPGVAQVEVQLASQKALRTLPNDTLMGQLWHLKYQSQPVALLGSDINAESAWNYGGSGGVRGSGVKIGMVDDGLETAHPDLAANVDITNDFDWNGNDSDPNPGTGNHHGTASAGVAAAVGNNALGVCGVAPEATLVGLRLVAGPSTDSMEAEAMAHQSGNIQIKSNSWGPDDDGVTLEGPGPLTRAALANAVTTGRGGLGTVFVWAGGNGLQFNDNANYDGYANDIHVIAVGATDPQLAQAYYSEPGANLLCVAPSSGTSLEVTTVDRTGSVGYNVGTSPSGDYTDTFGGTSASAPAVAGVVALMLEKNPGLGWRDVKEILIQTSRKISASDPDWVDNAAGFHFNHKFGAGLVDASAAVAAAATWTNLAAASTASVAQTGLGVQIPDNQPTGITRYFNVGASTLRTEHVTLTLSVAHAYRGDLAVTLTSPSGTSSRLAELHSDSGDDYTQWTFSTVRHWGEPSTGVWTLRVTDGRAGTTGVLSAATLTIHGAPGAPVNPSPEVTITSPTSGSIFSPSVPIAVAVSATDTLATGGPGVVSSVTLLLDGVAVGTDSTAPYEFSITPAAGAHVLSATATDSAGAVGQANDVTIAVGNQVPVISAVTLSHSAQFYADEALQVTEVTAHDPEGQPLTHSYVWQYSSDGATWLAAGNTTPTVAAAPGNAGKLWRCLVTTSDGVNNSATFTSAVVNGLHRPPSYSLVGSAVSYNSGLVLRGVEPSFDVPAIINEFSQGSTTGAEWVELLVLQPVSLRNWSLRDSTANTLTFANNAVWDNILPGTLIVIYRSASRDALLPPNDTDSSDHTLVLPSNNTTFFTGAWPSFGDSGDAVGLLNPSVEIQSAFSYGSATPLDLHFTSIGTSTAVYFREDTDTESTLLANWSSGAASTVVTPVAGNTGTNTAFVNALRGGTLFAPALYRLAAGMTLPSGLSLNTSSGEISGTLTASPGHYAVTVERYNTLSEVVSHSFVIHVTSGYAAWAAGYAVDAGLLADPDRDGLPNAVEYYLGTHPGSPSPQALLWAQDLSSVTFWADSTTRDVTGTVQWSTSLSTTGWSSSGVTYAVLETVGNMQHIQASLPTLGAGRFFVRLSVEQPP